MYLQSLPLLKGKAHVLLLSVTLIRGQPITKLISYDTNHNFIRQLLNSHFRTFT